MISDVRKAIVDKAFWDSKKEEYVVELPDVGEALYIEEQAGEPVIPQFVAEYIEQSRELTDRADAIMFNTYQDYFGGNLKDERMYRYLQEQNEFAKAVLYGYTVEKEKLYRVELIRGKYLIYNHKNNQLHNQELDAYVGDYEQREFTEQEIKAIDERYWAFAEEVTE